MSMLEKAKKLAKYTETLATGHIWGVDDQDTLEWLISRVEEIEGLPTSQQAVEADAKRCECPHHEISFRGGSHICHNCGLLLRTA